MPLTRMNPGEEFISQAGEFTLENLDLGAPLQISILASGYRRANRSNGSSAIARQASQATVAVFRLAAC